MSPVWVGKATVEAPRPRWTKLPWEKLLERLIEKAKDHGVDVAELMGR